MAKSINFQNFPKREGKEIRRIIRASEGKWLCSFDYGQIEARVIAMVARDESFCEEIRNDMDTHLFWAKKVVEIYPKVVNLNSLDEFLEHPKLVKEFRSTIKNSVVFPLFYGATIGLVASSLNIPDEIARTIFNEFWDTYPVIKEWQHETVERCYRYGYVENLLGRKRHMPMKYNDIINMPIQSLAYEVICNAMNRLSEKAYLMKKSQYQPLLQIHDDLLFELPDRTLEEDIEFIAKEMVNVPFDFVNVPIAVEVGIGDNWCDQEEYRVYTTDDFKKAA